MTTRCGQKQVSNRRPEAVSMDGEKLGPRQRQKENIRHDHQRQQLFAIHCVSFSVFFSDFSVKSSSEVKNGRICQPVTPGFLFKI